MHNHCKKIEDTINGLLDAFPPNGAAQLRALKLNYEAQVLKINAVSDDIAELLTTEDDLKVDMEVSLEMNDQFYSTIAKCE